MAEDEAADDWELVPLAVLTELNVDVEEDVGDDVLLDVRVGRALPLAVAVPEEESVELGVDEDDATDDADDVDDGVPELVDVAVMLDDAVD